MIWSGMKRLFWIQVSDENIYENESVSYSLVTNSLQPDPMDCSPDGASVHGIL